MREFDSVYSAFEEVAYEGYEVVIPFVGEEFAKEMSEIAVENIKPRRVKVRGYFELRSLASDGVERIKRALMEAYKARTNGVDLKIEYVGAPRYRIIVEADDYKVAETVLKKATDRVLKAIKKLGGEGKFVREAI